MIGRICGEYLMDGKIMKLGDLVMVRYLSSTASKDDWYRGMIISTPYEKMNIGHENMWSMWCTTTESVHILNPNKDTIKVLELEE